MTIAQGGGSSSKDLIRSVSGHSNNLMSEVSKVIIGKPENIRKVAIGILANGNILIEDNPGLAKTLMSNTFAKALGCKFKRVQFTPDLLPAGSLCVMPSIEGITHKLPAPFVTMATQNPIEQEGTYPLPEAQMDRFLMKMSMGYPSMDEEKAILQRRKLRGKDSYDVEQIVEPRKVVAMQKALETVHIDPQILGYIVQVVQRTRADPRIEAGASPRASQGLFKASRASAAIDGRDYVIPDDVKGVALDVVSHRIVLKPESKIRGVTGRRVVNKILSEVNVPVIQ